MRIFEITIYFFQYVKYLECIEIYLIFKSFIFKLRNKFDNSHFAPNFNVICRVKNYFKELQIK